MLEDSNFTYTYDENGNLTTKTSKVTTYTYDTENQLIRVDRPGTVAEYRYDALGRRIAKVVNGVSTRFVYDNEDLIAEVDASNIVPALYVHGPGIDEPLAMFRSMVGVSTFVFHPDGLGSITALTDTSGNLRRSYTYDSFGRLVAQTGTLTNPYTYTAREFDSETGLLYYRARYYDPTMGRFLQEDVGVVILSDVSSLNLYPYVSSDPVNFVDPFGLQKRSLLKEVIDVFELQLGVGVGLDVKVDAAIIKASIGAEAVSSARLQGGQLQVVAEKSAEAVIGIKRLVEIGFGVTDEIITVTSCEGALVEPRRTRQVTPGFKIGGLEGEPFKIGVSGTLLIVKGGFAINLSELADLATKTNAVIEPFGP